MGISRTTHSPTVVQRNLNLNRLRRRDLNQVRSLWWWGKQNRGGWFRSQSNNYEELEERLRRHQSFMMHRYSKALKRRALWDRDHSLNSSMWNYRGCSWEREMSSSDSKQAKVAGDENKTKSWQEFHKDFESFKAAVDRAIERDPYGTLFGRRLRSPESASRTSWTSWSWIFDPKEIKEDPIPEHEKDTKATSKSSKRNNSAFQDGAQTDNSHVQSSPKTDSTTTSANSTLYADSPLTSAAGQYVYDPISGRKVLQSPPPATSPKQENDSPKSIVSQVHDHMISPSRTGFLRSLFATENGVNISVKTYKPPKVYGYTGTPEPESKSEVKKDHPTTNGSKKFETSRKREYNQLRASLIGNSIDTTAEFGGKFEPESVKSENLQQTTSTENEPAEKRVRTSPSPDEDTPLFTGTTYASRQTASVKSFSDWLAKEGFREKQGMVMPSLKTENQSQTKIKEPAERIQPALDRVNGAGTDIPVKRFMPKIQPSIDRVVSTPFKSNTPEVPSDARYPAMSNPEQDLREDIDLLRASDVRAAAKAARVTKQTIEDKKRKERAELEKDFATRQAEDQSSMSVGEKTISQLSPLSNIWKHVKQYPMGIVAKTMQSVGLVPSRDENKQTSLSVQSLATSMQSQTRDTKPTLQTYNQLRSLASDLKGIFDEHEASAKVEAAKVSPSKAAPAFTEPTVKPGVVRNLEIERHTQIFEPKLAELKDQAKLIKRELQYVSTDVDGIYKSVKEAKARKELAESATETAPTTINITTVKEPATIITSSSTEISSAIAKGCPFIILTYNKTADDVNVTSLMSLVGNSKVSEAKQNVMSAIASLSHPNAFVKYFTEFDKNGYELKSGGGDILVFQKISVDGKEVGPSIPNLPSNSELRTTIAIAEAAAQPLSSTKIGTDSARAANVLDEVPTTIPTPGPAAPIAPTTTSSRIEKPSVPSTAIPTGSASRGKSEGQPHLGDVPRSDHTSQATAQIQSLRQRRSQIRRQEEVFSGQQRLPLQTTSLPDASHFQKQNPVEAPYAQSFTSGDQPSLFTRFRRTVRRIILTALAFGVGAYSIGVVAEGIASKAQLEGKSDGPMKRLVLETTEAKKAGERQRAGISSTESSPWR